MTYMKYPWLAVALSASACVLSRAPSEDWRTSGPSSPSPQTAGKAGAEAPMGAAGQGNNGPAGAGGVSGGASGARAAGTSASGAGRTAPDSGSGSGARGGSTSESDGGRAIDSGTAGDPGTECAPANIEGCNPVTNEGCAEALMMQCAVDFLATSTGYCIFYSGPTPVPGGECFNSGVTESCPPTFACVDSKCRELCFCDADCEAGQCCVEPLESTGFKVCGDC